MFYINFDVKADIITVSEESVFDCVFDFFEFLVAFEDKRTFVSYPLDGRELLQIENGCFDDTIRPIVLDDVWGKLITVPRF